MKLVRYGSRDSLTIDLGMAEVEGKKEKDEDFLVQCSQRLPSESEAAEVPTHDAVVALEEDVTTKWHSGILSLCSVKPNLQMECTGD